MQKIEETNGQSPRYLKTHGLTDRGTDRDDYIGPPWINRGPITQDRPFVFIITSSTTFLSTKTTIFRIFFKKEKKD